MVRLCSSESRLEGVGENKDMRLGRERIERIDGED